MRRGYAHVHIQSIGLLSSGLLSLQNVARLRLALRPLALSRKNHHPSLLHKSGIRIFYDSFTIGTSFVRTRAYLIGLSSDSAFSKPVVAFPASYFSII